MGALAKTIQTRPPKYNQDIITEAKAYVDEFDTEHGELIPSIAGLAKALRIHRGTLYRWAGEKGKKEIRDIMDWLLSDQELALINGGLSNKYNSTITKLMLGKHGYTDNPQQDQGVSITVDRTCGKTTIKKGRDTVTINDGKTVK